MQDIEKQAVHDLWDEMAQGSASRSVEMMECVLSRLSELVDAQQAYWMGTLRLQAIAETDPVQGWRARHIHYLKPSAEREAIRKEHYRRLDKGQIDPSIHENLKGAGQRFRINIKHKMVSDEWYETEFHQTMFVPLEICDVVYVAMPVSQDVESWMAFERCGKERPNFGDKEQMLLEYAIRPTQWFHKQLLLHHGVLLAEETLNASERRVMASLLTNKTEAEIAEELALSPSTVHTYCMRICRKFGVRGRNGLISLWLGETHESAPQPYRNDGAEE